MHHIVNKKSRAFRPGIVVRPSENDRRYRRNQREEMVREQNHPIRNLVMDLEREYRLADTGTVLMSCYIFAIRSMTALLMPVSLDSCRMESPVPNAFLTAASHFSPVHPPISCALSHPQAIRRRSIASRFSPPTFEYHHIKREALVFGLLHMVVATGFELLICLKHQSTSQHDV